MKTMLRSNKQIRIADDQAEHFKSLGFVEVDEETGVPLEQPEKEEKLSKKETGALKKENQELAAKVAALTQENQALKNSNSLLTAKVAELKKPKE